MPANGKSTYGIRRWGVHCMVCTRVLSECIAEYGLPVDLEHSLCHDCAPEFGGMHERCLRGYPRKVCEACFTSHPRIRQEFVSVSRAGQLVHVSRKPGKKSAYL